MSHRWLHVWVLALLLALSIVLSARNAFAYTADDTLAAIGEAADTYGVSYTWLHAIVRCETAGTFNPYSVGRLGEKGPVQLYARGELPRFYAWGYDDPFDPYQAVPFLAQRLLQGGARAWTCA